MNRWLDGIINPVISLRIEQKTVDNALLIINIQNTSSSLLTLQESVVFVESETSK